MENEKNYALQMRKAADKFNEDAAKENRSRHEKFVETIILPNIERSANAGLYNVYFTVCAGYSVDMVSDLLVELGFTVERYGSSSRTLHVKW